MRMAITLAKKGVGWVNPNPVVGAVIVKEDRVIGKGYHEIYGGGHAEVNAIRNATEPVNGGTLYVTLEPCCFSGKTPPCTDLILEQGIKRVVVGSLDPNPKVNGKGVEVLLSKGIEVASGILESECRSMNEIFNHFIITGLPFTILKTAMTLDGKIATVSNASRWISCERSRAHVHEIRQRVSAIMVGVDTVIYDDPTLNTRRRSRKNKNCIKVIADTSGRIPLDSKVLTHDPQLTLIATTSKADPGKLKNIERMGAQILVCPEKDHKVDLCFLIKALAAMEIDSILVEGGSTLAFSLLQEKLVNKVVTFISPKIIGGTKAPTPVGGKGIRKMDDAILLKEWNIRKSGVDFLIEGIL